MTEEQLQHILSDLLALPVESEWCEFKRVESNFNFDDLGKYFSALANEANLKNQPCAWLVFGVLDRPRQVVGTNYRPDRHSLDSLKQEISQHTTAGLTFREIHELRTDRGRVILFEIPAAPAALPISWKGHFYGRNGEALVALSIYEIETIRSQGAVADWSAEICQAATFHDLDPAALAEARQKFMRKQQARVPEDEITAWDTATLLDKAHVTHHGRITRTAILLLGKPEAAVHLSPGVAQITWKLTGPEEAYEHFGPPFLLNVNAVFQRIRNLRFRLQPFGQLIPIELEKYDPRVILEALNNCIAHQDYTRNSRILVSETVDHLRFENAGGFFEGSVEDYLLRNHTPACYRNPFLAHAMVELDMIDTVGRGIRLMFEEQRKRYFPLPEYDFTTPDHVALDVLGQLIDENYSRILIEHADLDLATVLLLDNVQKRKHIEPADLRRLRTRGLIEGRSPNIFVASAVADATGDRAQYIRNRAFDDSHYKKLILDFLRKFGAASRADIDRLLVGKLSDVLSPTQQAIKIKNLLATMARVDKTIENTGSRRASRWILLEQQK